MQELEAAETLQAAVMQQKSFSFPLTEEDKKEKKRQSIKKIRQHSPGKRSDPPPPRELWLTVWGGDEFLRHAGSCVACGLNYATKNDALQKKNNAHVFVHTCSHQQ